VNGDAIIPCFLSSSISAWPYVRSYVRQCKHSIRTMYAWFFFRIVCMYSAAFAKICVLEACRTIERAKHYEPYSSFFSPLRPPSTSTGHPL
jgi:hypothetical protein